jgi:hypothetical protein
MLEEKSEPIIYQINHRQNGNLKSIYQYIDRNRGPKKGIVYIPFWLCMMFCYLFLAILIFISAAIYISAFSKRPGLYTESCTDRSCANGLALKCINGTCLCTSNAYYVKGCHLKHNYLEKCHGNTNYCIENVNLICKNGFCECNVTSYWNNTFCVSKKTYGERCADTNQCLTNAQMICDFKKKKCSCNSDR